MIKNVLFVILNDFADWEAAPLAAAINQKDGWQVQTVSLTKAPIRSMGCFTVLPDMTVDEAMKTDFTGTILIGGKSWRSENAKQVVPLITYALRQNAVVGGICDASVFLGTTGALNSVAHTSNQLADLQDYAGAAYTGAERYQNIQAVRDGNIITANGTAALEFAKEALLALGTMTEQEADQWYALYKLGWYTAMKG